MSTSEINAVIDQLTHASVDGASTLSFAGRGLKLDNENDAQEIVDALHSSSNVNVLELKGNTLGVNAAKAIGHALEQHSDIKHALWSDLFTGRLKTEIPDALKYLCSGLMIAEANLVELDLSDNAFGPNGMTGLTEFLRSSSCYSLRELRLNNNGLGIQGGKMLADSLLACHSASVTAGRVLSLKVFVSGRGRLEDEGAIALADAFKAMCTLEEVHMPQNGINARGVSALADAFAVNKQLRVINLSDNTFTVHGSVSMAAALPRLQQIEVINFDDCLLRTAGAKAIAKALAVGSSQLKVLKLSGNEIGPSGGEAVAHAVSCKHHLQELDLNYNQLGNEAIAKIRGVLSSADHLTQLQSLSDDDGTEDEDQDEDDVSDSDQHAAAATDAAYDDDDDRKGDGSDDKDEVQVADSELQDCTVEEFLGSPSATKLDRLGEDRGKVLIEFLGNNICDPDKLLPVFIKISHAASQANEREKSVINESVDVVLAEAFEQARLQSSFSVLSNALLVHLGLIKSEDKNFKVPHVTDGTVAVLEHAVQQPYFPSSLKEMLRFFINQSSSKSDSAANLWHRLLLALHHTESDR